MRSREAYGERLRVGLSLLDALPPCAARSRAGVTWAELGALVGVSATTIRQRMATWSDAPHWPGVEALALLAAELGDDWPELVGAGVRSGLRTAVAQCAVGWPGA